MRFLLTAPLLVCILWLLGASGQEGSGERELYPTEASGECVIPPYISILPPLASSVELEDPLMLEGKCFLACLDQEVNITVSPSATCML